METSLKLQRDVMNNAEDLQRYMLDLQNWEEEMKLKDIGLKKGVKKEKDIPPPRNRIKTNNSEKRAGKILRDSEKKQRISAYDYSAWDKFDADKACAEIDEETEEIPEDVNTDANTFDVNTEESEENSKSEENDEASLKVLDEAFYEKELGNTFVKKGKWDDAIKCYTRAINLDSRNAIYYANRALCFIKLKNFKSAEVDSTVAIQLDNTYVKAYQRRAVSRTALGQLQEALSDYREILKLEPNNSLVNLEISKLEKKLKPSEVKKEKLVFNPKTIFKSETKSCSPSESKELVTKKVEEVKDVKKVEVSVKDKKEPKKQKKEIAEDADKKIQEVEENSNVFGKIPDGFTIVKPVYVPPHLRSKKPLRRVEIKQILSESETFNEFVNMCNEMQSEEEEKKERDENNKTQKILIDERVGILKENETDLNKMSLGKPKTFVEFTRNWKLVKNSCHHAFNYLKVCFQRKEDFKSILKHNLENDLFSELLVVLADGLVYEDAHFASDFLWELTGVDRFSCLVSFMSSTDRTSVKKCIHLIEEYADGDLNYWKLELNELKSLYGVAE